MVFRDLSVQRFDLLAGGFGLRSALCQLDTFAHSYGLERTPLSGEVERAKPDDAVDLAGSCTAGPRLLVNAERLECDVDFLLVPRLRVCIPSPRGVPGMLGSFGHRSTPSPLGVGRCPLASGRKGRQLSFACHLHLALPCDCLQCQDGKFTSVPF